MYSGDEALKFLSQTSDVWSFNFSFKGIGTSCSIDKVIMGYGPFLLL
jgi:hypothetical protein